MSGGLDILSLKEEDVTKMLCATTHIGNENVDYQMEQYVYKRRNDGMSFIVFSTFLSMDFILFIIFVQCQ